jgi:CRISPR-associated exonuclease Cas4
MSRTQSLEPPDYLPISRLNQFLYCPRRFWLMYVYAEIDINAVMLDGIHKHAHSHSPGVDWHPDGRVYRSMWVWSDPLRIAGVADFVQVADAGKMVPIEHKRGRMGKWLSDHIQLCAQALCLEERTGQPVSHGELFYWANRRREVVTLDDALRQKTTDTIAAVFALLERGRIPDPIIETAKCRDCSMQPICLPKEVLRLKRNRP